MATATSRGISTAGTTPHRRWKLGSIVIGLCVALLLIVVLYPVIWLLLMSSARRSLLNGDPEENTMGIALFITCFNDILSPQAGRTAVQRRFTSISGPR